MGLLVSGVETLPPGWLTAPCPEPEELSGWLVLEPVPLLDASPPFLPPKMALLKNRNTINMAAIISTREMTSTATRRGLAGAP